MVIGIDPGMGGGLSVGYKNGAVQTHTMPQTIGDMADLFYRIRHNEDGAIGEDAIVYMEELTGFTGGVNTGSSMFKMAKAYYPWETLCVVHEVRLEYIKPSMWMKALSMGTKKQYGTSSKWKNHLKERAQRLYPSLKITQKTADAVLIMHYGLIAENREAIRV